MIPFRLRFHGHGSLRFVYRNGRAVRSRVMTLKFTTNPHRKQSRIAVVVSKKVHKSAVGRNRMRRRMYEVIRRDLPLEDKAYDLVFIISSNEIITMPIDELRLVVHNLFHESGLYR